jgi:hypothetical protein
VFLTEGESKVLGSITFVNYDALLFIASQINVDKEEWLLPIIIIVFFRSLIIFIWLLLLQVLVLDFLHILFLDVLFLLLLQLVIGLLLIRPLISKVDENLLVIISFLGLLVSLISLLDSVWLILVLVFYKKIFQIKLKLVKNNRIRFRFR